MKERVKKMVANTLKYLGYGVLWFIIIMAWVLWVAFWISWLVIPYMILAYIFIPLIVVIFVKLKSLMFLQHARANIILFGGRGSGKSLTQQYLIFKDRDNKPMGNIDFGYNEVVSPYKFYEHISPNDSRRMINNTLVLVKKIKDYEGRNYYFDDTNSYAPNTEDAYLKKYYTSMSLFILIQRHLYNSYTVMNAQSLERMYKNLRELQLDGYVKALGHRGWGFVWSRLPVLRGFVRIKVRYYSQYESALNGQLPFEKIGAVNKGLEMGGMGYTTSAEATKKMYEATNGMIKDFALWFHKKHLRYDTREYHKHIFGYVSPSTVNAYVNRSESL